MYGLLGGLAGKPEPPKPAGDEADHMQVVALQTDGIPIGFTRYRPSDLTGFFPAWHDFVNNTGDTDLPPIGVPMGSRHRSVPGLS